MKIKLEIQVADSFVLKHMDDSPLPVEAIVAKIGNKFDIRVEESTFSSAIILVNEEDAEKIQKLVLEFVKRKYNEKNPSGVVELIIDEEIDIDGILMDFDDIIDGDSDKEKDEAIVPTAPVKTELESLKKINQLLGCEEFKRLASDIASLSAYIANGGSIEPFNYQAYIFSVNDGYGYSTILELFNSLLCEVGLKSADKGVLETVVAMPKDDKDPILSFADAIKALERGKYGIISIDISEWLHKTNTEVFRSFLKAVEANMEKATVVFRIPFVDKEMIDNVGRSLNDLVYVRDITIPPHNKEEIQGYAENKIKELGYKMSKEAWDIFHDRLTEEKADGRFYGLKTVEKVARELVYKKQLFDAKNNAKSEEITGEDALLIYPEAKDRELSVEEMLSRLVAGEKLKERINEVVVQIQLAKKEKNIKPPCVHMRFVGNPGTGKTTVARILGKILREKGILRIGSFYEYAGRDLCGQYIGSTAPKTASICRDAYGSVLFIDEAYSLYRGNNDTADYGREAIDTLIAEMENHRDDLLVIMAGYTDEMDTLMRANAGLASRMPYVIEFPNFTRDELYRIFVSMIDKATKYDEALLPDVKEYFDNIPSEVLNSKEFSNARFVRNLYERTWAKAVMRCQLEKLEEITLTRDDFARSSSDKEFSFIMKKKKARIGF